MTRSYDEINEKIRKGKAVLTRSRNGKTMTPKEILEKVDGYHCNVRSNVFKRSLAELTPTPPIRWRELRLTECR